MNKTEQFSVRSPILLRNRRAPLDAGDSNGPWTCQTYGDRDSSFPWANDGSTFDNRWFLCPRRLFFFLHI